MLVSSEARIIRKLTEMLPHLIQNLDGRELHTVGEISREPMQVWLLIVLHTT